MDDNRYNRVSGNIGRNCCQNFALAFHDANYRGFTSCATSTSTTPITTDISLVGFIFAVKSGVIS